MSTASIDSWEAVWACVKQPWLNFKHKQAARAFSEAVKELQKLDKEDKAIYHIRWANFYDSEYPPVSREHRRELFMCRKVADNLKNVVEVLGLFPYETGTRYKAEDTRLLQIYTQVVKQQAQNYALQLSLFVVENAKLKERQQQENREMLQREATNRPKAAKNKQETETETGVTETKTEIAAMEAASGDRVD